MSKKSRGFRSDYYIAKKFYIGEKEVRMLLVTHDVMLMLKYAVMHNPDLEVGGFGRTTLLQNGDILVSDIYIPPQTVESGHTDIKGPLEAGGEDMLGNARRYFATHCTTCGVDIFEHEQAVVDEDGVMQGHSPRAGSQLDWRLWWHSHGKLGSNFASQTDHQTLFGMARECEGWAVGLVVGVGRDRYTWIAGVDQSRPAMPKDLNAWPTQFEKDIEYGELSNEDDELKAYVADMMQKVQRKTYTQPGRPTWVGVPKQGALTVVGGEKTKILGMNTEEFNAWVDSLIGAE